MSINGFADASLDLARDALARIQAATYELSPHVPNPPRKKMTLARVIRAIDAGLGQGRDDKYVPWIRVRRSLCSPVSNLFVLHVPLYRFRSLHLMSTLERQAAQVAIWLGAREVREQMPLWPEEHLHPNLGRQGDQTRIIVPGLLDIARDAGIRHGVFPGTNVPYIATTDLLLEVPNADGTTRLVAWSCKPDEKRFGPNSTRVNDRIELERLYAGQIGAFHLVFSDNTVLRLLADQLDWFMPRQLTFDTFVRTALLEDFAGEFMRFARERTIPECREVAALKTRISEPTIGNQIFRVACWLGAIPMDFSKPILLTRRIKLDSGLRARLYAALFGPAQ